MMYNKNESIKFLDGLWSLLFLKHFFKYSFNLLLQKEEHIQFCIDILKYRILIGSLSITLYFRNYLTQYFSIALHFYPHQKNKSRYVQNQTQNEISLRRSVFYLNFLSKHAKCFLKRWMFTQNFQGSHFFFPWKCTDQVTSSECMYSWNALGKITSKISGNVGNINELCFVLNDSFHLNGKTNDVGLWYCYWNNISIFANCNNSIFGLWNIFGMHKNLCVCFFVIACQMWHFFDVFSCNSETHLMIRKINFSSLQFWSKVDLLPLVAQKWNKIHLVIKDLYKLTPLLNFMVW